MDKSLPKSSQSTPKKIMVFTPEQIAKLGLTSKLRSIIAPQLKNAKKETAAGSRTSKEEKNPKIETGKIAKPAIKKTFKYVEPIKIEDNEALSTEECKIPKKEVIDCETATAAAPIRRFVYKTKSPNTAASLDRITITNTLKDKLKSILDKSTSNDLTSKVSETPKQRTTKLTPTQPAIVQNVGRILPQNLKKSNAPNIIKNTSMAPPHSSTIIHNKPSIKEKINFSRVGPSTFVKSPSKFSVVKNEEVHFTSLEVNHMLTQRSNNVKKIRSSPTKLLEIKSELPEKDCKLTAKGSNKCVSSNAKFVTNLTVPLTRTMTVKSLSNIKILSVVKNAPQTENHTSIEPNPTNSPSVKISLNSLYLDNSNQMVKDSSTASPYIRNQVLNAAPNVTLPPISTLLPSLTFPSSKTAKSYTSERSDPDIPSYLSSFRDMTKLTDTTVMSGADGDETTSIVASSTNKIDIGLVNTASIPKPGEDDVILIDTTSIPIRRLDTASIPESGAHNVGVRIKDTTSIPELKCDNVDLRKIDTISIPVPKVDSVDVRKIDTTLIPVPKLDNVDTIDTTSIPFRIIDTTSIPEPKFDDVDLRILDTISIPIPKVELIDVRKINKTSIPVRVIDTASIPQSSADSLDVGIIDTIPDRLLDIASIPAAHCSDDVDIRVIGTTSPPTSKADIDARIMDKTSVRASTDNIVGVRITDTNSIPQWNVDNVKVKILDTASIPASSSDKADAISAQASSANNVRIMDTSSISESGADKSNVRITDTSPISESSADIVHVGIIDTTSIPASNIETKVIKRNPFKKVAPKLTSKRNLRTKSIPNSNNEVLLKPNDILSCPNISHEESTKKVHSIKEKIEDPIISVDQPLSNIRKESVIKVTGGPIKKEIISRDNTITDNMITEISLPVKNEKMSRIEDRMGSSTDKKVEYGTISAAKPITQVDSHNFLVEDDDFQLFSKATRRKSKIAKVAQENIASLKKVSKTNEPEEIYGRKQLSNSNITTPYKNIAAGSSESAIDSSTKPETVTGILVKKDDALNFKTTSRELINTIKHIGKQDDGIDTKDRDSPKERLPGNKKKRTRKSTLSDSKDVGNIEETKDVLDKGQSTTDLSTKFPRSKRLGSESIGGTEETHFIIHTKDKKVDKAIELPIGSDKKRIRRKSNRLISEKDLEEPVKEVSGKTLSKEEFGNFAEEKISNTEFMKGEQKSTTFLHKGQTNSEESPANEDIFKGSSLSIEEKIIEDNTNISKTKSRRSKRGIVTRDIEQNIDTSLESGNITNLQKRKDNEDGGMEANKEISCTIGEALIQPKLIKEQSFLNDNVSGSTGQEKIAKELKLDGQKIRKVRKPTGSLNDDQVSNPETSKIKENIIKDEEQQHIINDVGNTDEIIVINKNKGRRSKLIKGIDMKETLKGPVEDTVVAQEVLPEIEAPITRGRKSKLKIEDATKEEICISEEGKNDYKEDNDNEKLVLKSTRRSLRSVQLKSMGIEDSKNTIEPSIHECSTPKKRGRKSKIIIEDKIDSIDVNKDMVNEDSAEVILSIEESKKSKKLIHSPNADTSIKENTFAEQVIPETMIPRTRGRKSKVKTLDTPNEDSTNDGMTEEINMKDNIDIQINVELESRSKDLDSIDVEEIANNTIGKYDVQEEIIAGPKAAKKREKQSILKSLEITPKDSLKDDIAEDIKNMFQQDSNQINMEDSRSKAVQCRDNNIIEENVIVKESIPENKPSRKRGRKSNVRVEIAIKDSATDDIKISEDSNKILGEKIEEILINKLGVKGDNTDNTIEENVVIIPETKIPKTRRRKPKAKTEYSTNDSLNISEDMTNLFKENDEHILSSMQQDGTSKPAKVIDMEENAKNTIEEKVPCKEIVSEILINKTDMKEDNTDNTINENVVIIPETKTPKKRGRKPKVKLGDTPIEDSNISILEEEDDILIHKLPGRRSKPLYSTDMEEDNADCRFEENVEMETTTPEILVNKLSDRRSKSLNSTDMEDNVECSFEDSVVVQDIIPQTKIPKKRGRKPKIKIEDTSMEHSSHRSEDTEIQEDNVGCSFQENVVVQDIPQTKIPKKRGRKPKIKIEDTAMEDGINRSEDSHNERGAKRKADSDLEELITPSKTEIVEYSKRGRKRIRRVRDSSAEEDVDEYIAESSARKAKKQEENDKTFADVKQKRKSSDYSGINNESKKPRKSENIYGNRLMVVNDMVVYDRQTRVSKAKALYHSVINQFTSDIKVREETHSSKPDDTTTHLEEQVVTYIPPKRGRPRSNQLSVPLPIDFPPESAQFKKAKFVTCAVCKKVLEGKNWAVHKLRYHNDLAWKTTEPALDLENKDLVTYILNSVYARRKPLYCELCDQPKKSVLGYLSHKTQCMKTPEEIDALKITCEVCSNRIMPSSYLEHMRVHRHKEIADECRVQKEAEELKNQATDGDTKKRKAACRATNLIHTIAKDRDEGANLKKNEPRNSYEKNFFKKTLYTNMVFKKEIDANGFAKCRMPECQHQSATTMDADIHHEICDKRPEDCYVCKICIRIFYVEADVLNHVVTKHRKKTVKDWSGDISSASDSDESGGNISDVVEKEKPVRKPTPSTNPAGKCYDLKFLNGINKSTDISPHLNNTNYLWTLKFCEQNFSVENLFENYAFNETMWVPLNSKIVFDYLPNAKVSLPLAHTNVTSIDFGCNELPKFKRFKLFESETLPNGTSTIFCGGPVSALAWAPTPFTRQDCNQILAVSTLQDPDKAFYKSNISKGKSMIQFWNYGPIHNEREKLFVPKLEFCIAHDHGGIWDMAWCPSGCYNEKQLGLLAVTSTDSYVYCYSICQPGKLSGKIFLTKPTIKLNVSKVSEIDLGNAVFHATVLSWSKFAGHEVLAVGYSNGLVAVFNLNISTSTILHVAENGVNVIYPYLSFQANFCNITGISIYHMHGGKRWLVTSSTDRYVKFWDLQDVSIPITINKRMHINNIVWLNNWISSIDAQDECLSSTFRGTFPTGISHIREFGSKCHNFILNTSTSIHALDGSDWSNIIVQGSLSGELQAALMNNFMPFSRDVRIKKFYFGYTRLINITQGEQPAKKIDFTTKQMGYKHIDDNYGLVFCDFPKDDYNKMLKLSDDITLTRIGNFQNVLSNMYPIQNITKLAVNPNRYSFLFTAAGYQAGFVRVSYSKCFSRNSCRRFSLKLP